MEIRRVSDRNYSAHDPVSASTRSLTHRETNEPSFKDDANQTSASRKRKRKRDQGPAEEDDLENWSFARLKSHAINAERWEQEARTLRGTVDTLEGRLAATETEMRLL